MIHPVAFSIFGYDIRWYGIIIATGLLLAILLAMHHAKREGHNPDFVLDMALIIVPLAVIFARAYYVVFEWNKQFAGGPFWDVFAIWKGGLAIYGGVIGGFLGILIYWVLINRKRIGLYSLLDIAAPSLILGQAIGRWGNFVNQEAFGPIIDNPAWQWFPAAVKIYGPQGVFTDVYGTFNWHMATFFYESLWNFLVFAFLFLYFRSSKSRKPGNVFWFYLLLYGIGRAFIEGLRTDSLYVGESDVRISQILSIALVAVSAVMLLLPVIRRRMRQHDEEIRNTVLDDSLKLVPDEDPSAAEAQAESTGAPREEPPAEGEEKEEQA